MSAARYSTADRAVLQCAEQVRELAQTYTIAEVAFDPWRFEAPALELAERGIPIVAFPQSNARMVPASERLHAAIAEKRLQHPDDPALNAHVRAAIARDTPRGWRIDKLKSRDQIDAVVAWLWPSRPPRLLPPPSSCWDASEALPGRLRRPDKPRQLLSALRAPERLNEAVAEHPSAAYVSTVTTRARSRRPPRQRAEATNPSR